MFYQEALPQPALRAFVNCYWMIGSPEPTTLRDRSFPDGCQEIIFNVDTEVQRRDCGEDGYSRNAPVELVGQMSRPYDIVTRGSHLFFGVKFFPHSFAAFARESASELRDRSIDMRELLNGEFEAVAQAVFECPSFERFVASVERFLLGRLERERGIANERRYGLVEAAVRILFSEKAEARLDALPDRLGVGERYLQRLFKEQVGLSAKQLFRIIRFQSAFRYLSDRRRSLTGVAYCCGYYDQAHFTREFKSLAGVTPSDYRTMHAPLNRFFLGQDSRAYLCDFRAS